MTSHTKPKPTESDVVVGTKWRNRKSGIVAEVIAVESSTVLLKRDKRATTRKWIDLLLCDYDLLTDDEVTR